MEGACSLFECSLVRSGSLVDLGAKAGLWPLASCKLLVLRLACGRSEAANKDAITRPTVGQAQLLPLISDFLAVLGLAQEIS